MSDKIVSTCTECLFRNYTTTKSKKTRNGRAELMKLYKKCSKHTLHKETK